MEDWMIDESTSVVPDVAREVCFALWTAYTNPNPRSGVLLEDLTGFANCSPEIFLATVKSDKELMEIWRMSGFGRMLKLPKEFAELAF